MKTYDDVYKTAGAFSWNELTTGNPDAAATFYGQLFDWRFETMDMGMPYHVVKTAEGTAVAGIMGKPPGAEGMPSAWGSYVTVADADAAAKRCVELGGKVLNEPMDVPTIGRFAVLQDPQGAVFCVMAYSG